MKLKALFLTLIAALLVASGAAAKNGGGNGNGKGHAQSTAHAQSGGRHSTQGSKHEAKGHKAKAPKPKVKNPKKHETAAAEEIEETASDEAPDAEEPAVEGKNPAWTCRARLEERGDEQFVADYGTNANGANAFGKCVSSVTDGDEETAEAPESEEAGADAGTTLPPADGASPGGNAGTASDPAVLSEDEVLLAAARAVRAFAASL